MQKSVLGPGFCGIQQNIIKAGSFFCFFFMQAKASSLNDYLIIF